MVPGKMEKLREYKDPYPAVKRRFKKQQEVIF